MAENNWKDKLRQKMSDYSETPPKGLWEGIEGAMAPKTGAAGGFWAWLTGRPGMWPVWATAGVAAAAAAVLLLRTPAQPEIIPPVNNPDVIAEVTDSTVSGPATLAQTDIPEDITEEAPSVTKGSATVKPSKTRHPVTSSAESAQPDTKSVTPVADSVMPGEAGHPTKDVNPGEEEKSPSQDAVQETKEQKEDSQPVWTPDPFASTRVPLSKSVKRSRPLLAAALVGGSAPGGGSTSTTNTYGLPAGRFADAANPTMAMIGRTKLVQTEVSHRQDYQFGLLLNYSFSEHWGVESGVQVTGLTSVSTSSSEKSNITTTQKETFTYLGVPLRVVYTPFNFKSFALYLSAGPTAEYGLASRWESFDIYEEKQINPKSGSSRPGDWVWSASLNAGAQWQPWQYGAFFIQPGVVGRLVNEDSPESYYTTHPVSFQLSAGYKITF